MKEEALKLADSIDEFAQGGYSYKPSDFLKVSAMIRRLVEELDRKSKPVNHYEPTAWINHIKQTGGDFYDLNVSGRGEPLYRHPLQTKPLSDDEIKQIFADQTGYYIDSGLVKGLAVMDFARAIEERHGIK